MSKLTTALIIGGIIGALALVYYFVTSSSSSSGYGSGGGSGSGTTEIFNFPSPPSPQSVLNTPSPTSYGHVNPSYTGTSGNPNFTAGGVVKPQFVKGQGLSGGLISHSEAG